MNITESAKIIQRELDRQILEGSTSGWMEENAHQAIYHGGNKITFPKITHDITYAYESFELAQEIGKRFRIDSMDVDEYSIELTIANIIAEYQRTKTIPQIDAYRYSYLAKIAGVSKTYTPDIKTVFPAFMNDIEIAQFNNDFNKDIIITMNRPVYDKLVFFSSYAKYFKTGIIKQGDLELQVKTTLDIPIIPVPSRRMKTEYTFDSAGFSATALSKDINWIICPKSVPIAVSKTDTVKIITPDENEFADAWDIDYRKYHDLFIPENKKKYIIANISE